MCNIYRLLEIQILIEVILTYQLLKKESGKSPFSSAILLLEARKLGNLNLRIAR